MTNACKRLLNINISPSPPGGFLRKRPLQMYKKIRMERVMWIRNFLNIGYFALFFPFAGRNALILTSYKKEERSPNFGHETGLKLQKPGRKTSAYIFIFLSGSFLAHWRLSITSWIHILPLSGIQWHEEVHIAGYHYSRTSANHGKWWWNRCVHSASHCSIPVPGASVYYNHELRDPTW